MGKSVLFMTRAAAHDRGTELQKQGLEFFVEGKKPFLTYSATKDGTEIKASSTTVLVEKIDTHLKVSESVDRVLAKM